MAVKNLENFINEMNKQLVNQNKLAQDIQDIMKQEARVLREKTKEGKQEIEFIRKKNNGYNDLLKEELKIREQYKQYSDAIDLAKRKLGKNFDLTQYLSKFQQEQVAEFKNKIGQLKSQRFMAREGINLPQEAMASQMKTNGGGFMSQMGSSFMGKFGGNFAGFAPQAIAATIGLKIGEAIIGQLKKISDRVWNANEYKREYFKLGGNIYTTKEMAEGRGAAFVNRRYNMDVEFQKSAILDKYKMTDQAKESLDVYARAMGQTKGGFNATNAVKELEEIALHALASGKEFSEYMRDITTAVHRFGLNREDAKNMANVFADIEKQRGLQEGVIQQNAEAMYGSLSELGFSINQTAGYVTRFGKELNQGRISLQSIVEFAKGVQGANKGQSAFLIQEMSKMTGKSGDFAKKIIDLAGNNPLAIETALKAALSADPETLKELGMTQKEASDVTRGAAWNIAGNMAQQAGAGQNKYLQRSMLEMLEKSLGLSGLQGTSFENQTKLLQGKAGVGAVSFTPNYKDMAAFRKAAGKQIGVIEAPETAFKAAVIDFSTAVDNFISGSSKAGDYSTEMMSYIQSGEFNQALTAPKDFYGQTSLATFNAETFRKDLEKYIIKNPDILENKGFAKNVGTYFNLNAGVTPDQVINLINEMKNAKTIMDIERAIRNINTAESANRHKSVKGSANITTTKYANPLYN